MILNIKFAVDVGGILCFPLFLKLAVSISYSIEKRG